MNGTIHPMNSPCGKCGSYMYFVCEKKERFAHKCMTCGYCKYDNPRWYERLVFWKY